MNMYKLLEQAIISDNMEIKEKLTVQCLEYCNQNEVRVEDDFSPLIFETPSYASHCTIVTPAISLIEKILIRMKV
jgi:uncharacterized ferritin-like protein (DUF455 family)